VIRAYRAHCHKLTEAKLPFPWQRPANVVDHQSASAGALKPSCERHHSIFVFANDFDNSVIATAL
jgi:hypothetical protein